MLEPKRARETAMCYQPMKTKIDAEKAEDIYPRDKNNDSRPAKEPGNKRQGSKKMTESKSEHGVGLQFHCALLARLPLSVNIDHDHKVGGACGSNPPAAQSIDTQFGWNFVASSQGSPHHQAESLANSLLWFPRLPAQERTIDS
jgi:hypothetical protein